MSPENLVNEPQPLPEGVSHFTHKSAVVGGEIGYCVLLPPHYDDQHAGYPVLYWLHGRGGNESSGMHIAQMLRSEMIAENLPPMIAVFPNGGLESMWCDAKNGGISAESWLVDELIAEIDRSYATIANKKGRAVEGFSMGGFGAMRLALKYPDLFCIAVSHAGALHSVDSISRTRQSIFQRVFGGDDQIFLAESPYRLASQRAAHWPDDTKLYLTVGTEDPTWVHNLRFTGHLKAVGIPFDFRTYEGFVHDDVAHYDALQAGMLYPYREAFGAGHRQRGMRTWEGGTVHKNIECARIGNRRLLLDLYMPSGVGRPPVVAWVYGGAFRTGSKESCRAAFLTNHGFAVAAIEYRLSAEAVFPAQIVDCKSAIRWLKKHGEEYGYDATRIGVWGGSAGGYLAALLGTSGDNQLFDAGNDVDVASDVQAVCDYYGPTDFSVMNAGGSDMDHDSPYSPESVLIGGPITKYPELVARANPITYIDGAEPPFLIVHGDEDRIVPKNGSELLYRALHEAGVDAELVIIPGGDHGLTSSGFDEKVAEFFAEKLKQEN